MKKFFCFLISVIMLLSFSFFSFADVYIYDSPLIQPNFVIGLSPTKPGYYRFNFLLSGNETFLFQFDLNTDDNKPTVYLQSDSAGNLRFTYSIGSVFSSDFDLTIFNVLSGDIVNSISYSFSTSSTAFAIGSSRFGAFSLSEFESYYGEVNNSTNLILVDNINWSHFSSFPLVSFPDDHFYHFYPSIDWGYYSKFYSYSSSGVSDSWTSDIQLRNMYGRSMAFFQSNRFVPHLFTYSTASLLFHVIDSERSYVYGQRFVLNCDVYFERPMDTYVIVGSGSSLLSIGNILLYDRTDYNPTQLLTGMHAVQSEYRSGNHWYYSDYFLPESISREHFRHISLEFTIPENCSDDILSISFIQSISPEYEQFSSSSWAISDITIDPVGSSINVVNTHENAIRFQSEVSQQLSNIWNSVDNNGVLMLEGFSETNNLLSDIIDYIGGEGESYSSVETPSLDEYQSLEDELISDYSSDLSSAFSGNDNLFSTNGAFSFLSDLFSDIIFGNLKINSLILFCLCFGIAILIIGRKINA